MTANWINNMSAKDSYAQVYHLRRLLSRANAQNDRALMAAVARMLVRWYTNEQAISSAALKSHLEK